MRIGHSLFANHPLPLYSRIDSALNRTNGKLDVYPWMRDTDFGKHSFYEVR